MGFWVSDHWPGGIAATTARWTTSPLCMACSVILDKVTDLPQLLNLSQYKYKQKIHQNSNKQTTQEGSMVLGLANLPQVAFPGVVKCQMTAQASDTTKTNIQFQMHIHDPQCYAILHCSTAYTLPNQLTHNREKPPDPHSLCTYTSSTSPLWRFCLTVMYCTRCVNSFSTVRELPLQARVAPQHATEGAMTTMPLLQSKLTSFQQPLTHVT